ncbi:aminopeptidase [Halospeciosus flavus]|uniref:Aminopeptidase n=1 Tax=Halospeciosus flavus TaxID=3032283 RepID=A0ABD5Z7U4_9EURY|nr:aminopeptidase [Halospeciosus flavus]
MDSRIRDHADVIVDHSTDVQAGDRVVVSAPPAAEDLAVAVYERLAEEGATPVMLAGGQKLYGEDRASRAFLRTVDTDDLAEPEHLTALYEETDVAIRIRAPDNATEQSDVDEETNAAYQRAVKPTREILLSTRWCLTQYPTAGAAQLAGMSTEAYEEFVWNAVNKDWETQREHQEQMVERLDAADEVRIVSGDETDLTMSVAGMKTLNDYGEHNLPGGEVFTAPVPDSVEGEVLFDKPLYHNGREVEDAFLRFEDGEVVEHSAARNEETLTEILETDAGARRLGELGIGMNRDIDRFTYNMLFDEKMGDTVHLAVGMAYAECVPEDREPNDSATHVDMIVDMSEDSRIELDGDVVQRNGTFEFEEGFEG